MFSTQLRLLRLEYEHERAEFRREVETRGLRRRIREGRCWHPLTFGRAYRNALDRFVVEVERTEHQDVEHQFEYGRSIVFFDVDATDRLTFLDFTATVSYVADDRMVVVLPSEETLTRLHSLHRPGVALHFDETTYRLMFETLHRVAEAEGNRLAQLRDLLKNRKGRPQFAAATMEHLRLPWLNSTQEEAVRDILRARDVLIVHGPPGTGKTTTLVEAIDEVLRREPQVLVCAQSNTAIDWLALQLSRRGIPVLRVGNPTRVNDEMLASTYERRFEAHPDYPTLWQLRRELRELRTTAQHGRSEPRRRRVAQLRERIDSLELHIRQSLFDQARVVAATLTGAAQPLLAGMHFHTLFIDEAAQALEAACWMAIVHADRIVLAGDHCQLPPTVKSPEALRGGLGRTLMEQAAHDHPDTVRLLTIQYRMNETLMRFSSEWFYNGRLTAHPSVRHRNLLDDLTHPLVWIDTAAVAADIHANDTAGEDKGEHREGESLTNPIEAELTLHALRTFAARFTRHRLLDEGIDFGIISPYKAQVHLLRRLLHSDEYLRPLRRSITINTVDAFQGQEREVIILSLVRANTTGSIGFLNDLRRMNVAITRARSRLIVLGDSRTLCRHRFYRNLYERCHVVE